MSAEQIVKVAIVLIAILLVMYMLYDYNGRVQAKQVRQEAFYDNTPSPAPSQKVLSTPAPASASASAGNNVQPVVNGSLAPSAQANAVPSQASDHSAASAPKDCFPRDRLTAEELLPNNAVDTKWAQVNPAGQGDVQGQNFLSAGYHAGINTVGSSLRNANYQLRSEPPNPQVVVSPFLNSTISPDLNRKAFEIGGDY